MNDQVDQSQPENPPNHPTVELIIVSWNHAKFMDALFESLAKVTYPRDSWRIHVVINKDGDGTLEEVRRKLADLQPQLPEVRIHEPHANLGFAGGNNYVMQWAIQNHSDYVYLLNPDTEIFPDAIEEAIKVAKSEQLVGSVQSLLIRGDNQLEINSSGNALHFLGFGYAKGDHDPIEKAPTVPKPIGYPSGAGVLLPVKVLEEVGLFDETLFAYHEDLDLGWRIMLTGRSNYIAPKSKVIHHYEFSRSIEKWHLMERNRIIVILKNYKLLTILFMLPAFMATDMAIWAFAAKGGWLKQKFKASIFFLKPSTWSYLLKARERINRTRRAPDFLILPRMTYKIEYQELKSGLAERIANPFWGALYASYSFIISW
ncbi:MAG: glycosyltransferase family 2 protein [Patescibacteria group bacterium]|nr:glycosyltransferase family 2 protein [Patescibacteria group bacterium]